MENPSLNKKRRLTTQDGDMLDLSLPTVDKKLIRQVENMHFVSEEESMRLDVIANRYYGWSDKLDAIMWANDIFNPFAVDMGDWLVIPRVKDTDLWVVDPKVSKMPDENTQTTSSKISAAADKLNSKGKTAKEELAKKKKDARRPNELAPGETHKKVDGSVILLG